MMTNPTEDGAQYKLTAYASQGHLYGFLYPATAQGRLDLLRQLGRMAADPHLTFTWFDAAILSQRIRQEATVDASKKTPRKTTKH